MIDYNIEITYRNLISKLEDVLTKAEDELGFDHEITRGVYSAIDDINMMMYDDQRVNN